MKAKAGTCNVGPSRCDELAAFCSARTGDCTSSSAQRASAMTCGFLRAATRSATLGQRVRELAELCRRIVNFGKFPGNRFDFRRHFTEKIEKQRATVEQVLDIQQRGGNSSFPQAGSAGFQCFLSVLFEPSFQQFVFGGHSTQDRTVGILVNAVFGGRIKHFADFQTPAGAHHHAGGTWIRHRIDRGEPADVSQGSNSYKMMPRHITIVGYRAGRAKSIWIAQLPDFGFPARRFPGILGISKVAQQGR